MKKYLLFVFCITDFASYAQPGSLDNTFGIGGKITTDLANGYADGRSVAIQSDGRIVVTGTSYNGSNTDFGMVCYNYDGSLDIGFGNAGKINTDVSSFYDYAHSVIIQKDGKIVLAGYSWNGSDYDFALVRYHSNGNLDNNFGTAGKVTTDIGNSEDIGHSVAIQNDSKIVVAGYSGLPSNRDFALIRYNSDGSLDNFFGFGGKVTTDFGGTSDAANSVAIQSDGKIVVTGYSRLSRYRFALVRYNYAGTLDSTFGSGGKIITDFGGYGIGGTYGRSVAIQSDGKIVMAGDSFNSDYSGSALVRYNSNGTLDTTFGSDGKVTTVNGGSTSISIQNDGKIVTAGVRNNDFAVIRYNSGGSLDNTFGFGGQVVTDFSTSNDKGNSIAIQNDGKIIVAGSSGNLSSGDFAVARYNSGAVGVEETIDEGHFSIYPNPTTGKFNIESSENISSITVSSLLGEVVYSSTINSKRQTINLSSQPKGIYFVEAVIGNIRRTEKIIIE